MNPTDIVDLVSRFISQVGFPTAVAAFLLYKIVPELQALHAAVNRLCDKLDVPHNGVEVITKPHVEV